MLVDENKSTNWGNEINLNQINDWFLRRWEKPEYPEKLPLGEAKKIQQTEPTYDAQSGNRTRVTLVGGECSINHYAIPASHYYLACDSPHCLQIIYRRVQGRL